MSRVTKGELEAVVARLNGISKRNYRLDGAYGKTKLIVTYEDSTGISDVTHLHSKRELYDIVYGIIRYVEHEGKSPRLND